MPKLKTKSGVKKRFKMRADGTIVHRAAGRRHNMRKRSQKQKRNSRGTFELDKTDIVHIIRCAPYGL